MSLKTYCEEIRYSMIDSVAVSEEMNGTLVLISDIASMLYFAAHAGPLNTFSSHSTTCMHIIRR